MNEFLFGSTNWKAIRIAFLGVLGLLVVLSLIPIQSHNSHHTPIMRSKAQVRSLVQGAWVYAFDHDERFPEADQWPHELIELGIIEHEQLVSPAEFDEGVSYVCLPCSNNIFDEENANRILIYEDPTHYDEGVVVGFADAHVEIIKHKVFEKMLAEQLDSQDAEP